MNTSIINEPQLLVTVSDPTMLTKLKNAIKMMNGVSSISIMRPKKGSYNIVVFLTICISYANNCFTL